MQIIGHRGARGMWPENTLGGFARAMDAGVKAFELDVGITFNDVIVVTHDAHLNPELTRYPDGEYVGGSSWEGAKPVSLISHTSNGELHRYDVGRPRPDSPTAKKFPDQVAIDGERIPRLIDVLELIGDRAQVTIEVKTFPDDPVVLTRYVEALKKVVDNTPPWQDIIISSFNFQVIELVHKLIPGIPTAGLTDESNDHHTIIRVKNLGVQIWSPEYHDIDTLLVDEAHLMGLKVIPWTVNEAKDVEHMKMLGIDGIITDYPCRFENYGQGDKT